MIADWMFKLCLAVLAMASLGDSITFMFDMPARTSECFYHNFTDIEKFFFFYRVVRGGNLDINANISSPNGRGIFHHVRGRVGEHSFESSEGEYSFCFDNRFSEVSHKLIFFALKPAHYKLLRVKAADLRPAAASYVEHLCESVSRHMLNVSYIQESYRVREFVGRVFADDLNYRVHLVSIVLTSLMVTASIGQLVLIKRCFTETRETKSGGIAIAT